MVRATRGKKDASCRRYTFFQRSIICALVPNSVDCLRFADVADGIEKIRHSSRAWLQIHVQSKSACRRRIEKEAIFSLSFFCANCSITAGQYHVVAPINSTTPARDTLTTPNGIARATIVSGTLDRG